MVLFSYYRPEHPLPLRRARHARREPAVSYVRERRERGPLRAGGRVRVALHAARPVPAQRQLPEVRAPAPLVFKRRAVEPRAGRRGAAGSDGQARERAAGPADDAAARGEIRNALRRRRRPLRVGHDRRAARPGPALRAARRRARRPGGRAVQAGQARARPRVAAPAVRVRGLREYAGPLGVVGRDDAAAAGRDAAAQDGPRDAAAVGLRLGRRDAQVGDARPAPAAAVAAGRRALVRAVRRDRGVGRRRLGEEDARGRCLRVRGRRHGEPPAPLALRHDRERRRGRAAVAEPRAPRAPGRAAEPGARHARDDRRDPGGDVRGGAGGRRAAPRALRRLRRPGLPRRPLRVLRRPLRREIRGVDPLLRAARRGAEPGHPPGALRARRLRRAAEDAVEAAPRRRGRE